MFSISMRSPESRIFSGPMRRDCRALRHSIQTNSQETSTPYPRRNGDANLAGAAIPVRGTASAASRFPARAEPGSRSNIPRAVANGSRLAAIDGDDDGGHDYQRVRDEHGIRTAGVRSFRAYRCLAVADMERCADYLGTVYERSGYVLLGYRLHCR